MPINVLTIGGSRNIGYFSSMRLLESGATVTFLLRNPSVFDADETIRKYVGWGKARLVKGDALVKEDVQRAWEEAAKIMPVDTLVFTVGGTPKLHPTKGAIITPSNLVTESLFNALTTMPTTTPQPRIVAITSSGVSASSHAALPLLLKPMYSYLLAQPHKDKLGTERLLAHCAGWTWDAKNFGEPGEDIMGSDWTARPGMPAAGTLRRVLVVRPALLTDGDCVADKPRKEGKRPYRISEEDLDAAWKVSRKDVGHFVFDAIANRWEEFEDKSVTIAY